MTTTTTKCIIEEIVPRQLKGVERLQVYLSSQKLYLKGQSSDTSKPITLNKASIIKLITQRQISINDEVVTEKNVKIRANDRILIILPSTTITSSTTTTSPSSRQDNDIPQLSSKSSPSSVLSKESGITLVATKIDLNILYEDEWLVVINKPAGMIVHPPPPSPNHPLNEDNQTKTLVNALLYRYGPTGLSTVGGFDRPGIVHRLDKDTAGILIVAKNDNIHEQVKKMLKDHTSSTIQINSNNNKNSTTSSNQQQPIIQKTYYCLVTGKPKEPHGIINKAIARHPLDRNKMVIDQVKGKESITEYKVLKSWDKVDLEVIKPKKKDQSKETNNNDEYDIISNNIKKKKKNNNNNKNKKNNISRSNMAKNTKSKFIAIDSEEEEEDEDDDDDDDDEEEEDVPIKQRSKFVIIDSDEDEEENDDDDDDSADDSEDDSEETNSDEEEEEEEEEEDEEEEEQKYVGKKIGPRNYTLMEITLHTGRQHQIRVHMSSEGLPIVGDPIYSGKSNQYMVPYLLLASIKLQFQHPVTKQQLEFTIPNPSHLQSFIDQLDKEYLKQYPNHNSKNNNTINIGKQQQQKQQQISNQNQNKKQNQKSNKQDQDHDLELDLDMELMGIKKDNNNSKKKGRK